MQTNRNVLPPLDYLVAFEAAAKNGGFAGAARQLNLSESAISRKIRLLEEHYRVQLFVRGQRSVALTPEGGQLVAQVSRSLDTLREVSLDLLSRSEPQIVTLAATNSVAALWLMPRLTSFHEANKTLRIGLTASDSDEECLAEQMELSILRGDGNWPGYEAQKLFGETVFPVCAPGYLERFGKALTLDTLGEADLIEVTSRHIEWMNWRNWLAQKGRKVAAHGHSSIFNTYPLAVQAAVDGLGLTLGWGHLVDRELASGALVRPLGAEVVRTKSGYYLLRSKDKAMSKAQQTVVDWLLARSAERKRYGED